MAAAADGRRAVVDGAADTAAGTLADAAVAALSASRRAVAAAAATASAAATPAVTEATCAPTIASITTCACVGCGGLGCGCRGGEVWTRGAWSCGRIVRTGARGCLDAQRLLARCRCHRLQPAAAADSCDAGTPPPRAGTDSLGVCGATILWGMWGYDSVGYVGLRFCGVCGASILWGMWGFDSVGYVGLPFCGVCGATILWDALVALKTLIALERLGCTQTPWFHSDALVDLKHALIALEHESGTLAGRRSARVAAAAGGKLLSNSAPILA
eukprot:364952-Chlamydomonas_euryale.AAC.18